MDRRTTLDIGKAIEELVAIDWKDRNGGMSGCLAVKSIGRSGGSAMIWREWIEMIIQSYSTMHIDALVQLENKRYVHFTGFYGQADSNQRDLCWKNRSWKGILM
ncbi:hypothetical protein J1N35_005232 [Gossypium stocksii]|uniref:Uncharacterized protein n=1 Tax=Gossypium stocksii TaxID=47602 RepID=A0A9D4AGW8_9ROSI|nr:hypothetical protein J1N35_005232 [Gossypium stocksii]